MRERPILFSAPMVQALLAGTKTQTRRVVKPQPFADPNGHGWQWHGGAALVRAGYGAPYLHTDLDSILGAMPKACPYGKPGDRLWVTQGASFDRTVPFLDRYWSRVHKTDGCWEWFGHTNRKRYGVIKRDLKSVSVHRIAWELAHGPIPAGMHVLHRCDVPWCVNPEHLWLGTNEQNIADKVSKGRHRSPAGESQRDSRLTETQVEEIRALYWEQDAYQKDIAARFGIHQSQVSKIVNQKQWTSREEFPLVGRRTLEVTDVRVERLQEISAEDAIAEGWPHRATNGVDAPLRDAYPIGWYANLWNDINGAGAWDENPWVWVISFRRLTC